MEKLIKELKEEILDKEMTLLEMDNTVGEKTGSTTSLFDDENDCMEQTSCSYYINKNEEIVIAFEIIKKDENNLNTLVKIVNIWKL